MRLQRYVRKRRKICVMKMIDDALSFFLNYFPIPTLESLGHVLTRKWGKEILNGTPNNLTISR